MTLLVPRHREFLQFLAFYWTYLSHHFYLLPAWSKRKTAQDQPLALSLYFIPTRSFHPLCPYMWNSPCSPVPLLTAPTPAQCLPSRNDINLDLASVAGNPFVPLVLCAPLWGGFCFHFFIGITQAATTDDFLNRPVRCTLFLTHLYWNFDFINHTFLKCFPFGFWGI